jgi:hypothetical protein
MNHVVAPVVVASDFLGLLIESEPFGFQSHCHLDQEFGQGQNARGMFEDNGADDGGRHEGFGVDRNNLDFYCDLITAFKIKHFQIIIVFKTICHRYKNQTFSNPFEF